MQTSHDRIGPRVRVTLTPSELMAADGSRGAAVALILAIIGMLCLAVAGSTPAKAGEPAAPRFVSLAEMTQSALLFATGAADRYVEAPTLGTDMTVEVAGPVARTRVTQRFRNPSDVHVEAVYVFPLPQNAAVDTLKMVVGNRVIVGEIKARQEAKLIYEEAKAAGQKASLLEQERPNIFTSSVANIGPKESVVIQIEYQETPSQTGDAFSLRIPLVVAPRYAPPPVLQTVDFDVNGQGVGRIIDDVPDRDRLGGPVLDPRKTAPINPVTLSVRLDPGFALGAVTSSTHKINVRAEAGTAMRVTLDEGAVPADRDVELTWTAAPGHTPTVGLFRETVGEGDYVLAYVMPPAGAAVPDERAREIVFVIDNSGSMGGESIDQAKASLIYALGRLNGRDRFNVIRFDDTMDRLFEDTVPADRDRITQAIAFVSGLQAAGGTEMLAPLQSALTDPRPTDGSYLRQIVFLTDGAIGNEQQMLDAVAQRRGRSRVFMIGIGSAPNNYLMERLAELGRGTFTNIASTGEVAERMRALFAKLESPAVTDLRASFTAAGAEVTPDPLGDLYRGEPLVIAAKVAAVTGSLEISGRIGDEPWSASVPLDTAITANGISKLWARRKITDAEVLGTIGTIDRTETDRRVLALALDHHLVSRLTSLVAVDKMPGRPAGAKLVRADVPLNLPAGWDFDKVFGEARGGEEMTWPMEEAVARVIEASAALQAQPGAPVTNPAAAIRLPATATDAELRLALGIALLIVGLLLTGILRMRHPTHAR